VTTPHIVILGLMGAGKTTLGQALADHLGWPLSDSDAWLEHTLGQTARQLRDTLGAETLHQFEVEHLMEALRLPQPSVVCAAASVVENEACRRALAQPDLAKIWLRGSAAALAARFTSGGHRPAYGEEPIAFLAEQQERREHLFAACQPLGVDTDGKTADEVLAEVLERLAT